MDAYLERDDYAETGIRKGIESYLLATQRAVVVVFLESGKELKVDPGQDVVGVEGLEVFLESGKELKELELYECPICDKNLESGKELKVNYNQVVYLPHYLHWNPERN